jgi:DNA-3-methyladenine glycosylase
MDSSVSTLEVAQKILGASLISKVGNVITGGIITETEAYHQFGDEACHCKNGMHSRNSSMFLEYGYWYVYRSYGIHWCLNFVTETHGVGSAVLIRSIIPTVGVDIMRIRRGKIKDRDLTNGPGKVCQALGITGALNGTYGLAPQSSHLWIEFLDDFNIFPKKIVSSPRIGITRSTDLMWRFLLK